MAHFFYSLCRFLRRALSDLPSSIGSNQLGVWFPLLPALLFFGYQVYQSGWPAVRHDLFVGTLITLISYGLLFLYCVVRNVYREHVALVGELARSQSRLEYIENRSRWAGYESEQAWRSSINEQNRLVNLGHVIDGLFSPRQADAFLFVKELSGFIRQSMTSFPEHLDSRSSSIDEIRARSDERIEWRKRIESSYQLQFEERKRKLFLGFKAAGVNPHTSFLLPGARKIEEEIPRTIACIVVMAHEINHIKLAAREP
jgi:hypothetical protein